MCRALTTITTIGYGDFGPKMPEEIIFVVVAQVLGISVFALFLLQIQSLYDVRTSPV